MKTMTLLAAATLLTLVITSCKSTCSSCQRGAAAQNNGYRY